jgi:hypothetical protein
MRVLPTQDLRIQVRRSVDFPGAPVVTETFYLKGTWQRHDSSTALPPNNNRQEQLTSLITDSSVGTTIFVDHATKTFMRLSVATVDLRDNGERREVCDQLARHVEGTVTTWTKERSQILSLVILDGWYIDFPRREPSDISALLVGFDISAEPVSSREWQEVNVAPLGFPIQEFRCEQRSENVVITRTELISGSNEVLDVGLFAIPEEYSEAVGSSVSPFRRCSSMLRRVLRGVLPKRILS